MSKFKNILFVILFSFVITTAFSQSTQKNEHICDLHNIKMHKTIVKVHYGNFCPKEVKPEYANAKKVRCMGCVVRPPKKYYAFSYSCRKCNALKRKDKKYWEDLNIE